MEMPGRKLDSEDYRLGFNGMEKDDETYAEGGTAYDFGARIYSSRLGRWLATDPKEQKYLYTRPYNYTLNNPIKYIDTNGEEVTIHGEDVKATVAALQKMTSLQISMDDNGKLSAELPEEAGPLNEFDTALYEAVKDEEVNVNLYTTDAEWYESKDGSGEHPIEVGAYKGSEVVDGKVETTQLFNLGMSEKVEDAGLDVSGNAAAHEILESYHGGKDDPEGSYDTGYSSAHEKANNDDKNHVPNNSNYTDKSKSTGVTDFGTTDGKKKVKLGDNSSESKAKMLKKP